MMAAFTIPTPEAVDVINEINYAENNLTDVFSAIEDLLETGRFAPADAAKIIKEMDSVDYWSKRIRATVNENTLEA